jgi:hypothetical protein
MPPVAVNIDICGYLQFLSEYMPLTTFLVMKGFLVHRLVLIFQPAVNSRLRIIKASSVRTILVSWEKCTVTKCVRIYRHLWRGLGGGGGTFCLLNESLSFKGPEA